MKIGRIFLLCTLLFSLLISLCACDNTSPNSTSLNGTSSDSTSSIGNYEDLPSQESTPSSSCGATIEEAIIYNEHDVIIKTMGCTEDASGFHVQIYIENNSDLNLGFNARAYAVNGIMTNNNIYDMDCNVVAGKKANTVLDIDQAILDYFEIDCVRKIDVLFWAYDNDKFFKAFDTNQITISTSLNNDVRDWYTGQLIYDNNDITVEYLGQYGNQFGYCVTNLTGSYFSCDIENLCINDYTSSDIQFDAIGVIVLNNCQSLLFITVSDDFLELNSIDEISNLEFNLKISPYESYENEWYTDTITQILF